MELPAGYNNIQTKVVGNTAEEVVVEHIKHALKSEKSWIKQLPEHGGHAVIVGGGPSLVDHVEEIKLRSDDCQEIFALNNSWRILKDNEIDTDYHVMLDSRPENEEFILPSAIKYYASICHPDIQEKADVLWHPFIDGIQDHLGDDPSGEYLVGGGTSVGTRAMCLAYLMGFRNIHLYGFDSCYRENEHHAYSQKLNDNERIMDVWLGGKLFRCSPWMISQAEEFRDLMPQLVDLGCTITVQGEGLIPEMARQLAKPETVLTAVYDLSSSPPTYDFLSFLCAAEAERMRGDYSWLDVVFQPGPKDGFRDDKLPPDSETRMDMLWRICVPACRLLHSVRDVTVLKDRKEITGNVFPEEWAMNNPASRYGCSLVKHVPHILSATKGSLERISKEYPNPYVTITIRDCDYWPERNSNITEWETAADAIRDMGYEVVWIEDTNKSTSAYSWDIGLRMALYQNAVCNLMVSNGPADLLKLSNAPYLVFKPITPSCPSTTKEFLSGNGIEIGDQFGNNGKIVWDEDSSGVIIAHFNEFLEGCAADSFGERIAA